ncbi:MAG: NAD-dependent epimerase/dehydratase family protein [Verrucomicrobia bacterium]|nr:MAG: NAD-dependent epimerase/dehydratase family protein [Verrucomicrobiota bacterium]
MKPTKVLVTGAAGFIGSHVADGCRALGFDVVGIDDLSGGFLRNVSAGVTFEKGDIRDTAFVERVWKDHGPFDYVYHLAAYAAEGLSHHVRRFNYETNLVASAGLVNASVRHGVRHFVFASSIAVYGTGQLPLREEATPRPEDPYGIAKYAFELDLAAAGRLFGLPYTILRPHNVYGERQHYGDRYRNVVGIFVNQCLRGEPMTVFGDGLQTRAFSHVADVAPLFARAPLVAGAKNQILNVGADAPVRVIDLAAQVAAAMGVACSIRHLEARPEVVHAFADHARVSAVFGPEPSTPLETGIRRMAEWARTLGPLEPLRFSGIEVPECLPAAWE